MLRSVLEELRSGLENVVVGLLFRLDLILLGLLFQVRRGLVEMRCYRRRWRRSIGRVRRAVVLGVGLGREVSGLGREALAGLAGERLMLHERVAVRGLGGFVGGQVFVLLQSRQLRVLRKRLPLLGRRRRVGRFGLDCRFSRRHIFPGDLWPTADGSERFAFGTLDLGRIGTTPALEVEVLADRVVE
jgi:hypothetical protein